MAGGPSFFALTENGARLFVRATPNAGRDEIAGLRLGTDGAARLAVKVAAPPDKGRANAAVVRLLAKRLGVAKSSIAVVAGETARLKTLDIKGAPSALADALKGLAVPGDSPSKK